MVPMDASEWWDAHKSSFPVEPGTYLNSEPRVSYYEAVFFDRILSQLSGDGFSFDYASLYHQFR